MEIIFFKLMLQASKIFFVANLGAKAQNNMAQNMINMAYTRVYDFVVKIFSILTLEIALNI